MSGFFFTCSQADPEVPGLLCSRADQSGLWWLSVGCGGSVWVVVAQGGLWWLSVGCGGSVVGCGGSVVERQATNPEVPGSNPG